MPQFDILTLGAQVFGLLITLSFFYYFSINTVIPNFIEVKKFRTKKIIKNTKSISTTNLDLTNNKKLINNSYKLFMQ
uniref:ATPase subunit 8 n=1 Tax=Thalassiosira pseudonana TaxID=35128 RepID=Q3S296_THAPS|nr:ATPase subunit 8 [Thalassiosira pseudonana]AAZ99408.1 ATPase subunit 8 [Thalassiosira pseudonana]